MSAQYVQLDFFKPSDELSFLKEEFDALTTSQHNLRRGIFKRLNDLGSLLVKQQEQIEALEKQLLLVASNNKVKLPKV